MDRTKKKEELHSCKMLAGLPFAETVQQNIVWMLLSFLYFKSKKKPFYELKNTTQDPPETPSGKTNLLRLIFEY